MKKMSFRKNVQEVMAELKTNPKFRDNISHWHTIEEKEAKIVAMPGTIDEKLKEVLAKRGITNLYTHQETAYEAVRKKEHFVAVTPTASGKTLCYNLVRKSYQKLQLSIELRTISSFRTCAHRIPH